MIEKNLHMLGIEEVIAENPTLIDEGENRDKNTLNVLDKQIQEIRRKLLHRMCHREHDIEGSLSSELEELKKEVNSLRSENLHYTSLIEEISKRIVLKYGNLCRSLKFEYFNIQAQYYIKKYREYLNDLESLY